MKNTSLRQSLVGLVAGTALTLGALGLGGCNHNLDYNQIRDCNRTKEICKRIEDSENCFFYKRDKEVFLREYKSIDLNNLDDKQKEFLKLNYKKKIEIIKDSIFTDYLSHYEIINPDKERLTNRDLLILYEYYLKSH